MAAVASKCPWRLRAAVTILPTLLDKAQRTVSMQQHSVCYNIHTNITKHISQCQLNHMPAAACHFCPLHHPAVVVHNRTVQLVDLYKLSTRKRTGSTPAAAAAGGSGSKRAGAVLQQEAAKRQQQGAKGEFVFLCLYGFAWPLWPAMCVEGAEASCYTLWFWGGGIKQSREGSAKRAWAADHESSCCAADTCDFVSSRGRHMGQCCAIAVLPGQVLLMVFLLSFHALSR